MENNQLFLHPHIRVAFLISSIIGTILIDNSMLLASYYGIIILPTYIFSRQMQKHFSLMLFGMVPIFLSFVLLYIVIFRGSNGNWYFINLKMLKLIIYTSAFQLALSIPSQHLVHTFKMWGFRKDALITLLGAFTVWADIKFRADKIITARFSRGFISKRTLVNKVKQLPFVLVPLMIGIIRTSTERAESWEQKNIITLVESYKAIKIKYPATMNILLGVFSTSWLFFGVWYKIKS